MKKIFITIAAVSAAAVMLPALSVADTIADDTPVFSQTSVNTAAKTDLSSAASKSYQSQTRIEAFDDRYKVTGQGNADPR